MEDGRLVLIAGALVCAALLASLAAGRLRVPSLLGFMFIGMAIGSDGAGWIDFSDYELARDIGVIALAMILFEGGLASGWQEIGPVIRPAIGLALVGTAITAGITGLAASWVLGLSTLEGLLLGSIVASTDSASIFALLRGSTLRRRLARTLEGESGLNDPIAILLVIVFIEAIDDPDFAVADAGVLLVREIGLGLAVGLLWGRLASLFLGRVRLASAGLYPVASLGAAAVAFGGAEFAHGSGFMAVYLCGLMIGSTPSPARRTMATFHDGLAWVAQLTLFLTLGLLVFPSDLGPAALDGLILALVLVLVARPVGALAGTAFAGFSFAERLAIGWAGLRGAVPVVLATFPVIEGLDGSVEFFNVVFFAVILSTLLQGMTFERVARALGVTGTARALPTPLLEPVTLRRLGAEVIEVPVAEGDLIVGLPVRELGLPREALLNVVIRGDQAIPPRGSTRVRAGDRLHVLVRQEVAVEFAALTRRWRSGPLEVRRPAPVVRRSTLLTIRPWRTLDGHPGDVRTVNGIDVLQRLRSRRDVPGSLVLLADGRYAVTGPVIAVGPPQALLDEARRRLRSAQNDDERGWWREVVGALAMPD